MSQGSLTPYHLRAGTHTLSATGHTVGKYSAVIAVHNICARRSSQRYARHGVPKC